MFNLAEEVTKVISRHEVDGSYDPASQMWKSASAPLGLWGITASNGCVPKECAFGGYPPQWGQDGDYSFTDDHTDC